MITPEGQRRSKCLRSKMRNETQDRYSHSPCKAIEFANAREAIQYIEETEFQKGHQLYFEKKYDGDEISNRVLSTKYFYCAWKIFDVGCVVRWTN